MTDRIFQVYLLFVLSYFLHLPARFPVLGLIRFDLLLVLIIFAGLFLNSKDDLKASINSTSKTIKVLVVYIIVTVPFVQWPGSVLHTNFPNFIKVIIFFYFTIYLIKSEKQLKLFLNIFVVCQVFRILEPLYLHVTTGYWGDRAHMGGGEFLSRLGGSPYDLVNPNGLAFVIAMTIPFLHYMAGWHGKKGKLLYVVLLPALLYTLVLTASRSGFVAIAIIYFGIFIKSNHKIVIAVVSSLILSVGYSNLNDLQKDRYRSLFSSDARGSETAQGRWVGIKADFAVAMNRPILGHGLGTSVEANAHAGGHAMLSHNLYTEIMQELGMVGLIIFLWFIKTIIQNFIISLREIRESGVNDVYLINLVHAMQVWLFMNIIFSFASYGLSSYEWYLFGGLSVVIQRLILERAKGESSTPNAQVENAKTVRSFTRG